MGRQRTFTFVPYEPKKGKVKEDFVPFAKVTKAGQMYIGKESLEKLGLNKLMFYRIYVDVSKRSIGLTFSEEKGLTDNWKVWSPIAYASKSSKEGSAKSIKVAISIISFLNQLTEVTLPSQRLPIGIYEDSDVNQKFYYVRIPYKDETPGGRKIDNWK